jgi:uncharacterized protein (UPF0335 family)
MNRLLLFVLLLFQFIDSVGYRLPIMIAGQPKTIFRRCKRIEREKKEIENETEISFRF